MQQLGRSLDVDKIQIISYSEREIKQLCTRFATLLDSRDAINATRRELNSLKRIGFSSLKLYVSHFIQVLNFAIDRGEIRKECRSYYGLGIHTGVLPLFSRESAIIIWTDKVIRGEEQRTRNGSIHLSHPDIKTIKNKLQQCRTIVSELSVQEKQMITVQEEIKKARLEIDRMIRKVWDEIDTLYEDEPPASRRKKAAQHGVVYVE